MDPNLRIGSAADAGDRGRVSEDHLRIALRAIFIDSIQLVTGVALLLNRYVPLALVVSAAFLYNILAFHITMFPAGIVPSLILTVCWVVLALSIRERLAPLLVH
jgi:hypothetical protein